MTWQRGLFERPLSLCNDSCDLTLRMKKTRQGVRLTGWSRFDRRSLAALAFGGFAAKARWPENPRGPRPTTIRGRKPPFPETARLLDGSARYGLRLCLMLLALRKGAIGHLVRDTAVLPSVAFFKRS
jgi:hypothetical protein